MILEAFLAARVLFSGGLGYQPVAPGAMLSIRAESQQVALEIEGIASLAKKQEADYGGSWGESERVTLGVKSGLGEFGVGAARRYYHGNGFTPAISPEVYYQRWGWRFGASLPDNSQHKTAALSVELRSKHVRSGVALVRHEENGQRDLGSEVWIAFGFSKKN